MAEGEHEVTVIAAEQVGIDATIDVDRADTVTTYHERDTHDRADAVGHDTLLPFQVIIDHGIIGGDGRSIAHHTVYGAAADLILESALVNGAFFFIACDSEVQLAGGGIHEHEETAFGLDNIDYFVHDQAQYFIKFKR